MKHEGARRKWRHIRPLLPPSSLHAVSCPSSLDCMAPGIGLAEVTDTCVKLGSYMWKNYTVCVAELRILRHFLVRLVQAEREDVVVQQRQVVGRNVEVRVDKSDEVCAVHNWSKSV